MFGKLASLFDRNFAVGYFLPIALFMAAHVGLATVMGYLPKLLELSKAQDFNVLVGTTVFGLFAWLGGVVMVALNRSILRLKEGYGRVNPVRLMKFLQMRTYRNLNASLAQLNREKADCDQQGKQLAPSKRAARNRASSQLATNFPDDERWLLPTAFGNAIRGFEVYPRVMYGLDAIPGWTRLVLVLPSSARDLVDAEKAQLDFWVNVWLLSLLFALESGVVLYKWQHKRVDAAIPLVALLISLIASLRARGAATQWGEVVKSCFDVYLPTLYKKMGLASPAAPNTNFDLWVQFSRAAMYRRRAQMPPRNWNAEQQTERTEDGSQEDPEEQDDEGNEDEAEGFDDAGGGG